MTGFQLKAADGRARSGILETAHGKVRTPAFMPVATKATVKTLTPGELEDMGTGALISNSFVLYLRPGLDTIEAAGGLHRFMGWDGTIFTDSGGFQMLREEFLEGVGKKGIRFRSPFDNSRHLITPEDSAIIQARLGSDVAMVLDDCPPYGVTEERAGESVARTTDWAGRFLAAHPRDGQMVFAILQGGTFPALRRKSAEGLSSMDFDGFGIGGLSIGEPAGLMFESLDISVSYLPEEKPRYFMGLGSPVEVLEAVGRGVDVFDSAFPTRNARHNAVYTKSGKYDISKAARELEVFPLEEGCPCYTCRTFTRAYVSHLMRTYEPLGMRLVTIHNLHFMQDLMQRARKAVEAGEFMEFKDGFVRTYTE